MGMGFASVRSYAFRPYFCQSEVSKDVSTMEGERKAAGAGGKMVRSRSEGEGSGGILEGLPAMGRR